MLCRRPVIPITNLLLMLVRDSWCNVCILLIVLCTPRLSRLRICNNVLTIWNVAFKKALLLIVCKNSKLFMDFLLTLVHSNLQVIPYLLCFLTHHSIVSSNMLSSLHCQLKLTNLQSLTAPQHILVILSLQCNNTVILWALLILYVGSNLHRNNYRVVH